MAVTSLLGSSGGRRSRSGTLTVVVVNVEDTAGGLGRRGGDVGARRSSGRGSRGSSRRSGSGRSGSRGGGLGVRVAVVLVSDTSLSTASDLEGVDVWMSATTRT